jgi:phage pi2 protein 07
MTEKDMFNPGSIIESSKRHKSSKHRTAGDLLLARHVETAIRQQAGSKVFRVSCRMDDEWTVTPEELKNFLERSFFDQHSDKYYEYYVKKVYEARECDMVECGTAQYMDTRAAERLQKDGALAQFMYQHRGTRMPPSGDSCMYPGAPRPTVEYTPIVIGEYYCGHEGGVAIGIRSKRVVKDHT